MNSEVTVAIILENAVLNIDQHFKEFYGRDRCIAVHIRMSPIHALQVLNEINARFF